MDSEEIFSYLIQRTFQFDEFSKTILNGTVDLTHLDLNQAIKACIREMANPRPNEMGTSPVLVNIRIEDYKSG